MTNYYSAFTAPQTGGALLSVTTYTSGSGTYTVPSGVNHIVVECQGAGGGSGGTASISAFNIAVSGGGGGGGYCRKFISTSSGSTFSYGVGAAGTAGSAGNNAGGTGGSTTFSTLTAVGGTGGGGAASSGAGTAGAGGTASGGDVNFTGGVGLVQIGSTYSTISSFPSGQGGSSFFGPVIQGVEPSAGTAVIGNAGLTNQGNGASGTYSTAPSGSLSAATGAAGGSGLIVIWQYS